MGSKDAFESEKYGVFAVLKQFLLNISGSVNYREKFVMTLFVENVIVRFFIKNTSTLVQGIRSYGQNSFQNGVLKHFFEYVRSFRF